ncbi:Seryl-tRNA synthetase [hydrothermal vent metagenome]|uniref:Serine--tRNA ligase n=1 Tax=hydrothermal vent metagenome TaxID=652676 RepID=A0A3B0TZ77_9ZZZZ
MHDLRWIRENPQAFDRGLARRGLEPQSKPILDRDEIRRQVLTDLQELQSRRNEASKAIGKAKASGDEAAAQKIIDEVAALKAQVQAAEDEARRIEGELNAQLAAIPNMPLDDVPDGADENDNPVHHTHGKPRQMNFTPREHFEIGEALGLMDFDVAARMSGARFVVLKGALARMEHALASLMLDIHTGENGYTQISPPLLVRDEAMFGTAQLPKFRDDQFGTSSGHWLIPTAEVPLTNLVREQILDEAALPQRVTAYTPCFRLEAGAAGRDTRGMIRQHQFPKVELVSITRPKDSAAELERMLGCAEEVLKRLGLHYRVVTLCTGDMGFAAQKTYDIEVWLPGQGAYREISSCSVCGDFQARRMNARFRPQGEKGTRFVHTLNGSGVAVGRALVAVLENYQQEDGSVVVPDALRPYMGGIEVIEPTGKPS